MLPFAYFLTTSVFAFTNDYLDSQSDTAALSATFSLFFILLLFGQLTLLLVMWLAVFESADRTQRTLLEQQAAKGLRPPLSPPLGDDVEGKGWGERCAACITPAPVAHRYSCSA